MTAETAFDRADENIFDSLGQAATYNPSVGDPVACQIFLDFEVDLQPPGYESGAWEKGILLEARLDEIGKEPNEGETFDLTGSSRRFTVRSIIENDGRDVKAVVTESVTP